MLDKVKPGPPATPTFQESQHQVSKCRLWCSQVGGWLKFPATQIALWLGVYAILGYSFGKFAFLFASPLLAVGLRRPLLALASTVRHKMRTLVWLPVHGQHYVFRDITIHVLEDDRGERWIPLADVQKVVGKTAAERALAATYPGRLKTMGSPARPYIRDDALVAHLGKVNQPEALRLSVWVERNIALPGRRKKKNLAIDAATSGARPLP